MRGAPAIAVPRLRRRKRVELADAGLRVRIVTRDVEVRRDREHAREGFVRAGLDAARVHRELERVVRPVPARARRGAPSRASAIEQEDLNNDARDRDRGRPRRRRSRRSRTPTARGGFAGEAGRRRDGGTGPRAGGGRRRDARPARQTDRAPLTWRGRPGRRGTRTARCGWPRSRRRGSWRYA